MDLDVSYQKEFQYTQKPIEPEVKVIFGEKTYVTAETPKDVNKMEPQENVSVVLKKGQDYIVRYYNNQNAGIGEIQIEGVGNYQGIRRLKFTIAPKNLKNSKITMGTRYKYTGKSRSPYVVVSLDGKILIQGKDYIKILRNHRKDESL